MALPKMSHILKSLWATKKVIGQVLVIAAMMLVARRNACDLRVVVTKFVHTVVLVTGSATEMGLADMLTVGVNFPTNLLDSPAKLSDMNFGIRERVSIPQPTEVKPVLRWVYLREPIQWLSESRRIKGGLGRDCACAQGLSRKGCFSKKFLLCDFMVELAGTENGKYADGWRTSDILPMGSNFDVRNWLYWFSVDCRICRQFRRVFLRTYEGPLDGVKSLTIELVRVNHLGKLPMVIFNVQLTSFRPADDLLLTAVRLSGVPAFIELIDTGVFEESRYFDV
ncbi:MAG: hypothetical protein LAO09_18790, partial [Acidobacteriia bacterium]|nr:hypothetical protein [Terriglobia bacterium]